MMVHRKYEAIIGRTTTLKRIRIRDFHHSHVSFLIPNEEKEFPIK